MLTASVSKKENIAEYLLYMWQIEDLIRAFGLDLDRIKANIVDKYTGLTDKEKKDMTEWYESLIDMMRREGVAETGHIQLNKNVILTLTDLHNRLMQDSRFSDYNAQYYKTLPYIVEIRSKAGCNKKGEIESCFDALYGLLLLRLQKKEVSEETSLATKQISSYLSMLAGYYKKDYNDELFNNN